jgi:hypothetical protein
MGAIAYQIRAEVGGWPGVETGSHRFGGVEFRVAGHEIGHLHGDRLADLPFPTRIRRELVESGRALPHHVLPDSGWVSFRIGGPDDVTAVVALFRLNYDRITAAAREPSQQEPEEHPAEEPAALPADVAEERTAETPAAATTVVTEAHPAKAPATAPADAAVHAGEPEPV